MKAVVTCAVVASVIALTPADAMAQARGCERAPGLTSCLPADNLWANAHGPFTWLAPATPAPARELSVGFVTSWIYRPLGLTTSSADPTGTTTYVVDHAVTATLVANLGLTSRLSFDLAAPFTLYQSGAGLGFVTGEADELPRSAVGELRLGPSVALLRRPSLDVSARAQVLAPMGNPRGFSRSPSVTFATGVSGFYRVGAWGLGVDLGGRFREAVTFGDAVIGHQISIGLGATYDLLPHRWLTVGAEAFSLFALDSQRSLGADANEPDASSSLLMPTEWLVTFTTGRLLDGKLKARVGMGGAIPTGATSDVTAPALRTVAMLALTP